MKRTGLFLFLLAACDSDESMKVFNELPTVNITSHSEGATSQDGYTETFRAALSDPNHETSDLRAQWYLNSEVVCEWLVPDETGTSMQLVVIVLLRNVPQSTAMNRVSHHSHALLFPHLHTSSVVVQPGFVDNRIVVP